MVTHVVKRAGHSEPFIEEKLHASLNSAALSVRALEGEAELLAARVSSAVSDWVHDKAEVTSLDVRAVATGLLSELHEDAAYAYDTHDFTL